MAYLGPFRKVACLHIWTHTCLHQCQQHAEKHQQQAEGRAREIMMSLDKATKTGLKASCDWTAMDWKQRLEKLKSAGCFDKVVKHDMMRRTIEHSISWCMYAQLQLQEHQRGYCCCTFVAAVVIVVVVVVHAASLSVQDWILGYVCGCV